MSSRLHIIGQNSIWLASNNTAKINIDARSNGDGARLHKWNRNYQDTAYLTYYEQWYDGSTYHSIGVSGDRWKLSDGLDVSGTITGTNLSGTNTGDQTNITGNAATATTANAVSFGSVTGSSRVGLDLTIKPSSNGYGGFIFQNFAGTHAGYLIMRDTSDAGNIYKANGITLVADSGWLTLAQRTAGGVGVRIMTGTTSVERINVVDSTTTISNQLHAAGIKGGTISTAQGARFIDVGYSGSCYIQANRTDGYTSQILFGAAQSATGIWSRIGTTTGNAANNNNSARQFTINVGTSVAVTVATNRYVTLHGGGNTSDIILKKNIEDHGYGLDAVNNLKPRKFNWREHTLPQEKQVGFIAQELQEVIPEAVYGYDGAKAIMPSAMISVLTKAIQELSQQVTALKAEVELLKQ